MKKILYYLNYWFKKMVKISDGFLDGNARSLMVLFFIYRESHQHLVNNVNKYFLDLLDKYEMTKDDWVMVIGEIRYFLYNEIEGLLSIVFNDIDNVIDSNKYTEKSKLKNVINYAMNNHRISIRASTLERITEDYYNYINHDVEILSTPLGERYYIVESYISDFMNYMSDFLLTIIYDVRNKRKKKRGAISKNKSLKEKVFAIVIATVEKIPNISDFRLTVAIEEHFSKHPNNVSRNTYLAWIQECRESMGIECSDLDTYKKSFSLVIPYE